MTPEHVERFLASRPRQRPRSYNHLLGTVRRLFNWMRDQDRVPRSPVQARPRRQTSQRVPFIFDLPTARQLLDVARCLPDGPRAPRRGETYHAVFAILYGLGLRVGEACRLQVRDVDLDRRLLVIRQTKFNKDRLVPFGPRMETLLQGYLGTRAQEESGRHRGPRLLLHPPGRDPPGHGKPGLPQTRSAPRAPDPARDARLRGFTI